MIERKAYPVANLKVADEQQGVIEAIVSVFNNVDHGNEKVLPGFFAKSIERKLPKGVWAHDWKQPIAKTLEAKELLPGDPLLPDSLKLLGGAYIKGQFNLDTQRGREAYSDIKFGIVDEFSIGYAVLKDGKDQETGARELIEGDWKEWSPVLVGMNDQTALISIKSEEEAETKTIRKCDEGDGEEGKPWCLYSSTGKLLGSHATRQECVEQEEAIEANKPNKGMLAEELAQTTPSTWEIESAFRRIIRKIAETAKNAPSIGESTFDWRAKVTEVVGEYGPTLQPLIIAQIEEFLESSDDEFYLKGITGLESFESFESAGLALEKFAQQMRSNHEWRLKEGRVLSATNRAKVQACMDKIMELHSELSDLMVMSEPKPKETETEKTVSLVALKAQSARLRNHALRTLARIA